MESADESASDNGWEAVVSDDGRTYYWNSATDEVAWELPTEQRATESTKPSYATMTMALNVGEDAETAAQAGFYARRKMLPFSYSSAAGPTRLDVGASSKGPGKAFAGTKAMRGLSTLWSQVAASQEQVDEMQAIHTRSLLDHCLAASLAHGLGCAFTQWRKCIASTIARSFA